MITQSVDNIVVATEAAFCKALLVTNSGSIIPASIIFTMFPVTTSIPSLALFGVSLLKPALLSIVLKGDNIASERTLLPILILFSFNDALTKAIPPPGTIPSLIAALVAQIASSTLSLFSFHQQLTLEVVLENFQ